MSDAKTKPSDASIQDYLAARASASQRADCEALIHMFRSITGEEPRMWGPSIVGFSSYRYPLASGKVGESCATGFAVRGRELVIYLIAESPSQAALLAKLGKHKFGKACLYFKQLADLDRMVLEQLIQGSLQELKHRYG